MQDLNLYGDDLFGEPIKPESRGVIADKFVFPPFSVLDARCGAWQDRKRAWASLGIKGEVGRDAITYNTTDWLEEIGGSIDTGTSIFDPTLTELAYRWWCPKGGQVVDPFAGGSVRGIVAALLDRKYWGCDLRQEQINANEVQAEEILGDTVSIKVSSKMMRQMFKPCTAEYINANCLGRCCQGTEEIKVTIHPTEKTKFEQLGAQIDGEFIAADERGLCPFKDDNGLCKIHADKPMGCRFSPFTLNPNNTLIVRNRYRCLKCYGGEESIPAYKAHEWSLCQVLGDKEAQRIINHLDSGGGDITAKMPCKNYAIMRDNDAAKGNKIDGSTRPLWVCGDSMETLDKAPDADFIFSCPPYGDLEKYSDDPQDLSSMEWHTFVAAYKRIILRSVKRLKENRFACFVVGDFRDKKGFYRNFVSETIAGFEACGARLYNEAVLVMSAGSASMRVNKQFVGGRKLVKTHQNILVFCKGDWRKATSACGVID